MRRGALRIVAPVLVAVAGFGGAGACSSVPDVVFTDDGSVALGDASADAPARPDGTSTGETGPPPSYACPGNPPPLGTCCGGDRLAANFAGPNDCARCEADCTPSQVCCKRGGNKVDCVASVAACD